MHMKCPNCSTTVPVVLRRESAGAGVSYGADTCGQATDSREFALEAPGPKDSPHLRLVPRPRSLEVVRTELLDAHKAHVNASEMQDAAEKAARLAAHNTVEKLARIQQLRNELVRLVEQQPEACAS